jgi:deazaflavin-dependent oxidoreductase (nitroreductase family)
MANWGWFSQAHRAVYRRSGGRIGRRMMGIPMLLLTTVGRRSGIERTTPLACFQDGEDLVVVASNNGQEHDPAWWLNLQANPRARVQLGREERAVLAERTTPEKYARLWPLLKQGNPSYRRYERQTQREIPVVVLRPAG